MNIRNFSTRVTFSFAILLAACMAWTRPAIASGDDQAVIAATRGVEVQDIIRRMVSRVPSIVGRARTVAGVK